MNPAISLRTLGSLDLRDRAGREVRPALQQPKRMALLVFLALMAPRGYQRRDTLLNLFWPDLDTEHARAALRRALYFLRQQLGEEVLVNRGDEEVGITEGRLLCDAVEFERLLPKDPSGALELYQGHLLEGFYIAGAPDAERWLDQQRSQLRELAVNAAWKLAESDGTDAETAAALGRRAAAFTPDDPAALQRLARLTRKLGGAAPAARDDAEPGLVAVLPFTVHGDPSHGYLAEGMMDLLSTALNGAGDLRTAEPHTTLGAEYHLQGSVVAQGGRLRISATMKRVSDGDVVSRGEVQLEKEQDLFDLVDELGRQLVTARIGGPGARLARIAAVTTSSFPALKAYLRGEQDLRAGRNFDALAAFSEATMLDPAFALAHYRLAGCCAATAMIEPAREASTRALAQRDRLTPRDRILLDAQYAWLHGRVAEAERRYGTAVAMYPDDLEAWFLLGDALFHSNPYRGRSISEAREPLERAVALEPGHVGSLVKLARIAALAGDRARLLTIVRQVLAISPAGDQALAMRALRGFFLRDEAEQDEVLAALPGARALSAVIAFGDVALYTADLAGAERIGRAFAEVARSDELQALCHLMVAHLAVAGGRIGAANEALARAEPLAPAWTLEVRGLFAALPFLPPAGPAAAAALEAWDPATARVKVSVPLLLHNDVHPQLRAWLLGQLAARREDAEGTARWAEALAELPVPATAVTAIERLTRSLDAQAHRLQGRPADALHAIEGATTDVWYQHAIASPFFAGTFDRLLRASLLEQAGRKDEALAWYGSMTERSAWELPFAAPAALGAARINAEAGRRSEAARWFGRAAAIWKDCDESLRPVQQDAAARARA